MITLFIDTSLNDIIIAIVKNNEILSYIKESSPNMHSIYATKYLNDALNNSNINKKDIDNIMVVNGPGSFTGLRIGVTIAKTYGYLIDKYITPTSSLKNLAISYSNDCSVISIIKANKSSYYVGIYDKEYNEIIKPRFINEQELIKLINQYKTVIISNDIKQLGEYKVVNIEIDVLKVVNYYLDKEKVNYFAILPNYLKEPQAVEDRK